MPTGTIGVPPWQPARCRARAFEHRNLYVFGGGQRRQQVERLKDEADFSGAKAVQIEAVRERLVFEQICPAWACESARAIEQRRFSAATGA